MKSAEDSDKPSFHLQTISLLFSHSDVVAVFLPWLLGIAVGFTAGFADGSRGLDGFACSQVMHVGEIDLRALCVRCHTLNVFDGFVLCGAMAQGQPLTPDLRTTTNTVNHSWGHIDRGL